MTSRRTTAIALLVGGIIGAVIGAIVAVNIVIFAGPDQGYESRPSDVYEHSPVLAVVTVAVLVAGPIAGAAIARRMRSRAPS